MKKHLLGTSAIVAASMGMASVTMAQAPSPVSITVNGFIGEYFALGSQNNVGPSNLGTNPLNSTRTNSSRIQHSDLISDTRLQFRGSTTLADGFRVGVLIEIPGAQAGSANYNHIRETSIFVDSTWGRITIGNPTAINRGMVGTTYSTGNAFSSGSPVDVLLRNGMVAGGHMHSFLVNPTGSSGTTGTINSETGDMNEGSTNKVNYLSPRIFGVQAGFSWIPEYSRDVVGTGEVVNKDGQRAAYRNGLAFGVNYVGNFAGIDVAAGFSYGTILDAPNKSALGLTTGATTASINDGIFPGTRVPRPEQYQAGVQVHYAGFKVGAGYGSISNARVLQTGLSEFTGQSAFRVSTINSSLLGIEGHGWSVGGSYTFGPAAVSVNYTNARNNDCPIVTVADSRACSGSDRFSAIGVSGNYVLGQGVSLGIGGFYGKYRGNNYNNGALVIPTSSGTQTTYTNASQNNEGAGVIGGILVRF